MHHEYGNDFVARFNSKFQACEGCWNWTAGRAATGYGQIRSGKKTRLAHRVSYELHTGPIPHGLFVCHRCDNRRCVNPAHLFLGTAADNTRDMLAKGRQRSPGARRQARGDSHGRRHLSAAAVAAIRRRVAAGERQCDVRKDYSISSGHICHIVKGKYWKATVPPL